MRWIWDWITTIFNAAIFFMVRFTWKGIADDALQQYLVRAYRMGFTDGLSPKHNNLGKCPDKLMGLMLRDENCPMCQKIIRRFNGDWNDFLGEEGNFLKYLAREKQMRNGE